MKITKLKLKNFKSFLNAEIELDDFTVILGANASGKSNLMSIFRFLKNIMTYGLDHAIAVHGGINNIVCALKPRSYDPISIEFCMVSRDDRWISSSQYAVPFSIAAINYKFEIMPHKRGSGYKITHDEVQIKYRCYSTNNKVKENNSKYIFSNTIFNVIFSRKNGAKKVSALYNFDYLSDERPSIDEELLFDDIGGNFFKRFMSEYNKELMLYRLSVLLPPIFSDDYFINIYDFDPKLLKRACSMTSVLHLQEDGSNLAAVLKNILKSKESMKNFIKILNKVLPFVSSISVENNFDQSFTYKVSERYSSKAFYSNFLSDGTVSIIAIIIALYFEELSNLIVLEEPERNVHPMLLESIVEMAKDISNRRQIVFTTHNAEILKNVDLDNVRLIKRNNNGESEVVVPKNNKMVQTFMKNDLGLNELFLQNLLG